MYLLKYNKAHEENLLQFKNDLFMLLSEIFNDNQLINKYIGDFYMYYDNVKNMLDSINGSTDVSTKYLIKPELNYEFIFELDPNIDNPTINLESINLIKTNFDYDINLSSDKIKKEDYNMFCDKFDINYLFTVYEYPYFIINIKKNNEYKHHYSFYEYKTLILKNTANDEIIHFDFEKNIVYYEYVSKSINETTNEIVDETVDEIVNESDDGSVAESVDGSVDESVDESVNCNKFFIWANKIVVNDGPIYPIKKLSNNAISLDNIIYEIDTSSTLKIEFLYKLMNL